MNQNPNHQNGEGQEDRWVGLTLCGKKKLGNHVFPDQRRSALYREREQQQPARHKRAREQCDSPGSNGEISHDNLFKDKLLFLMIAILTSYHPSRFVWSFFVVVCICGRTLSPLKSDSESTLS